MSLLDWFKKRKKRARKPEENATANSTESNTEEAQNATQETPFDPSTVNMDDYKGHVALAGIGKGSCSKLLNKVTVVAFLVNEFNSAWDDAAIAAFKRVLERVAETLQNESGLTKNELAVSYAYDIVPVQRKYIRGHSNEIESDVLTQYGHGSVAAYQAHYEKKFRKNEAPVLFVFNRDFRSYAHHDTSEEGNKSHSEYSFISFRGDENDAVRTVMHELMHQFGCIDYYYPETVKAAADEYLPDSIMNGGLVFDDLTKYIIGWQKWPTLNMVGFLNATKNVTEEDIDEGRKEQDKYDW